MKTFIFTLVLASCWIRHHAQQSGCDCVPVDQCFTAPPPGGAAVCSTINGTAGVCCDHAGDNNSGLPACSAPVLCQPADSDGVQLCTLADGSSGIVCSPPGRPAEPARHLAGRQQVLSAPPGSFSSEAAQRQASLASAQLSELEEQLTAVLHRPGVEEADLTGLQTAAGGDPIVAQEVGRIGLQRLFTAQAIANQTLLESESLSSWSAAAEDVRRRIPGCVPATGSVCGRASAGIRTLGGQCNNLEHPFLGRSLTGLSRLTNATFEDRLYFSPRSLAADGSPLPSADAAGALVAGQQRVEPLSRWAATVSEYLSLDLARITPFRLPGGREPDCCSESHPACLPLDVDGRCVSFVRALPAPELDCVMRPAAPLSAASSYLDLETLYGSSEEAGRQLRAFRGGRLRADRGLLMDVTGQVLDLDYHLLDSAGSSQEVLLRRRRDVDPATGDEGGEAVTGSATGLDAGDDDEETGERETGTNVADVRLGRQAPSGNGTGSGDKGSMGEKGKRGKRGFKGMKGDKGMKGENGKKGEKGLKGTDGMKGVDGKKGEMGLKGTDGVKGGKGDKGIKGVKGVKGGKGMDGEKGIKGVKGGKGMNGDKGIKGEKGMKGGKGDKGIKGVKGVKGDKGMDGEKGMKGVKGGKGMNGDKGIKGEKGMKGGKGDKGIKGVKGVKGGKGMDGEKGMKGVKGGKGMNGDKGIKGETGMKGGKGDKGIKGVNGVKGDKGMDGTKGMKGLKGGKGMDGEKGIKGEKGEKGLQGIKGLLGAKGAKGQAGEKGTIGTKGENGKKGDRGVKGFGDKGDKGVTGDKGRMGLTGPQGGGGKQGPMGQQGRPGPRGPPGSVRIVSPIHFGHGLSDDNLRRLWAPTERAAASTAGRGLAPSSSPDQLHQLLLREHNRVADALRRQHPLWEDERVFQVARRVVVAEWQHITYREYLPHVLGATAAGAGAGAEAGAGVDPTVSVEFALAAFRFWQRPRSGETRRVTLGVGSSANFLEMMRGTSGVAHNATGSSELAAVEVLRGRELGLPTYAAVRQLCTGESVTDWANLEGVMDHSELEVLRATYDSPRDVDLWVGGMLERRAPSAKVGPTFQCVIADQFRRLRDGDRLFYERSLSDEQLREVRKSSLARLLCDNEEGRSAVAPLVLEPLTGQNKMTLCTSSAIPRLDLSQF